MAISGVRAGDEISLIAKNSEKGFILDYIQRVNLNNANAKVDPTGPETGSNRVRRGGGKADGLNCSVFYHNGLDPNFSTSDQVGFRIVLEK